jgi:uncharacterized membrane protein YcfT
VRSTRRLSWVDPAKGAAVAMVVMYHATQYLAPVGVDVFLGRARAVFELFPLPALFLIAGMAAAPHAGMSLGQLWWRRTWPVVYVYFLWSLMRAVVYGVVPGLPVGESDPPAAAWRTLVTLPVLPSSLYWFLYALILYMLLRRLIARFPGWVQVVASLVVSAAFSASLVTVDNVGWTRIGVLFVFYVVGAVFANHLKAAVDSTSWIHVVPLGLGALLTAGALLLGLRHLPGLATLGQFLAVAAGVVAVAHLRTGRLRNALTSLGRQSFRVYLVHIFPVALICLGLDLLHPDWPRPVDLAVQVATIVLVLWVSLRFSVVSGRWRWLYAPPGWLTRGTSGRGVRRRGIEADVPS